MGIIASGFLLLATALGPVHAQGGTVSATVRPNPLTVSVSAPDPVTVGQWFYIKAEVTNLGNQAITNTVVTINTPAGIIVRGQKKIKIGDLTGSQTQTVTWLAKANSSGTFIIQVEATGDLAGEQISSSDSLSISAVSSLAAFLFRLIFNV
ncbi:MAG: hypothetical protein HYW63_00760 [Candidatus Levybacteria bacterium]|nr:hypothetical protein [Candidatus Levybacteria bacterium]